MTSLRPPETTSRRGLLAGLVLALPLLAYGVRGVFVDGGRVHPAELARWVAGAAVVNDLVVVPPALAVGWAARRVTPARHWPAVRNGLVVSGALALVSWPFVRGYGRSSGNPSLFPRNYAAGLAAALVLVWLSVAAWVAIGEWRRRRRQRASADADQVDHEDEGLVGTDHATGAA